MTASIVSLPSLLAHGLQAITSSFLTWKTLALVLALINLKNVPFAWHVSFKQ